jgi:hypothetical protein
MASPVAGDSPGATAGVRAVTRQIAKAAERNLLMFITSTGILIISNYRWYMFRA